MTRLCLTDNSNGQGGIAGGAGNIGQTSLQATGAYATSYGFPVIDITTGMTQQFTVQLTDDMGGTVPSDLNGIQKILFVARPSMHTSHKKFCVQCTKVQNQAGQATGQVTFELGPAQVNNNQGLHYAQILCYDAQDKLRRNYRCYLQIRKGATGAQQGSNWPVTVAQVRMAIMDTSPQANRLLDDLEFSDVMIAQCIQRAVSQWNQTPPTLARQFTVATFPYRQALIQGAVAYLMSMVTYRYARNRMQHSNAGLSMDDSDKQAVYSNLAAQAKAQWRAFVASKKTELNMQQCFGMWSEPWFQSTDDIWFK